MSIEWVDSYNMGHAELDARRRQLVDLTNALIAASDVATLRSLTLQIYKQARASFELEEALMRELGFADSEAHAAHHARIVAKLDILSMDVGKGHMNKLGIEALVRDWAQRHIVQDDALLARFLARRS